MNFCIFSPCRGYRYTLKHRWDELQPERAVMWIGLNPSTADEQNLDPTLRRVKAFSTAWGYNAFVMTNLFAFRATEPKDMMRAADSVGTANDEHLVNTARDCIALVACWGAHGSHLDRAKQVLALLGDYGHAKALFCLGLTKDGAPRHPLYVAGATPLQPFSLK